VEGSFSVSSSPSSATFSVNACLPPLIPVPSPPGTGGEGSVASAFRAAPSPAVSVGEGCSLLPERSRRAAGGVRWAKVSLRHGPS